MNMKLTAAAALIAIAGMASIASAATVSFGTSGWVDQDVDPVIIGINATFTDKVTDTVSFALELLNSSFL